MLLQGDLEDASRWADAFISQPPDQPLLWLEESHLTKARILLARDKDRDVQSALHILDALYEIAQRTFNSRFQIEILTLRALALDMQGQAGDALTALQQAVELSRPGGFIRVFADLGPRMQVMLLRLAGQGFATETIRRMLATFPAPLKEIETRAPESEIRNVRSELGEPLSRRELDVLALLRERLSNKEIAHQLGLSSSTVKRYTVTLYEKLDVNRRWDAVIKAEALGIFPPR
jgi:LuxR family maltose regulon positive regulatory protein